MEIFKTNWIRWVFIGIFLLGLIWSVGVWWYAKSLESPKYEVLEKIGDIEVRKYEPMLVAEVNLEGRSMDDRFMVLGNFIFGKNDGGKSVAMTTPVIDGGGANIAMTTPVLDENSGRMAFPMPREWSMDSLPKPLDERVKIEEIPAKIKYVRRFMLVDFDDMGKREKVREEFLKDLDQENLSYAGGAEFAFYNPPWTPFFLRRNEVMVEALNYEIKKNIMDNSEKKLLQKYSENLENELRDAGKIYGIFFHADWCVTCREWEKLVDENLDKFPKGSVILEADFDEDVDLRKKLNVISQSTLVVFGEDGEEIDRKINPSLGRTLEMMRGEVVEKSWQTPSSSPLSGGEDKLRSVSLGKKWENFSRENFDSYGDFYEVIKEEKGLSVATLAGGCFWCLEGPFEAEDGVVEVFAGFSGKSLEGESVTYEKVTSGEQKLRESVEVFYDAEQISYEEILEIFLRQIDVTDAGGQFADRGFHYTTAIFYREENEKKLGELALEKLENSGKFEDGIAVKVLPYERFYLAEESHQNYYLNAKGHYDRYKKGSGRAAGIEENEEIYDGIFEEEKSEKFSLDLSNLTEEQIWVTQECGTETPFANAFWDHKEEGLYVDIVTGEPLFSSRDKFDSGTGWPSFTKTIADTVKEEFDFSHGMSRVEVRSRSGDSHLGHVFDDGPRESGGKRYCINSAALRFVALGDMEGEGYEEFLGLFE